MAHRETIYRRERFSEDRFAQLLCYPRPSREALADRRRELDSLGVTAVESHGSQDLHGIRILGKGCVSVVVLAHSESGRVALKIRRMDADRPDMSREARYLEVANKSGVGPRLIAQSANFLLMEYVEGSTLQEWLKTSRSKTRMKSILRSVMEDCWRLDKVGLDHGELSAAPKHILIPERDKPVIIDFESASTSRRMANVTSVCQYLFIGSALAATIQRLIDPFDKDQLIEKLRKYKTTSTREAFEDILNIIDLKK